MAPIVYDKLVRDRIPEIIEAEGLRCRTRVLSAEEFRARLRLKLDEEIRELDESGAVEELVDILEIVYALAALGGVNAAELERMRLVKRETRGGFDRRLLLIDAGA